MMSNGIVVIFTLLIIVLLTKMRGGTGMNMSQPRVPYYDVGSNVGYKARREFVIAKSSGPVFIQNDGEMKNHFGMRMDTRAGRARPRELTIPKGCYEENTALIPEHVLDSYDYGEIYEKEHAYTCQLLCQEKEWCYFFMFNHKHKLCWLKKATAPFHVKVNQRSNNFKDKRFRHTNEFVFGPKYCNEICPGQCKCSSGNEDDPIGGHKLNPYEFCDHHCSSEKFPAFGQCGNTARYKLGQDCEECRDYSGSNIACSTEKKENELEVNYYEKFTFGCTVRRKAWKRLHYCMIEVLRSDGTMDRCVFKKEGGWYYGKLVPKKGYCENEVLRTNVRPVGSDKDWCALELRLSKLNGEGDNWKGIRMGLGYRWEFKKNGFGLSKNNHFFKLSIKNPPRRSLG